MVTLLGILVVMAAVTANMIEVAWVIQGSDKPTIVSQLIALLEWITYPWETGKCPLRKAFPVMKVNLAVRKVAYCLSILSEISLMGGNH